MLPLSTSGRAPDGPTATTRPWRRFPVTIAVWWVCLAVARQTTTTTTTTTTPPSSWHSTTTKWPDHYYYPSSCVCSFGLPSLHHHHGCHCHCCCPRATTTIHATTRPTGGWVALPRATRLRRDPQSWMTLRPERPRQPAIHQIPWP